MRCHSLWIHQAWGPDQIPLLQWPALQEEANILVLKGTESTQHGVNTSVWIVPLQPVWRDTDLSDADGEAAQSLTCLVHMADGDTSLQEEPTGSAISPPPIERIVHSIMSVESGGP